MLKIVASAPVLITPEPTLHQSDMTTFLGRATLVLTKDAEHRMSRVLLRKS